MTDSCTQIDPKRTKEIATEYLGNLEANPPRKFHVLKESGAQGKGVKAMAQYIANVIRFHNEVNGNIGEPIMPKNTAELDKWVDDYIEKTHRDNDMLNRGRTGSVSVGNDSVGNIEIIDIMDNRTETHGIDVLQMVKKDGSIRQRISRFVKKTIEQQLKRELGSVEAYIDADKRFSEIVDLFENMQDDAKFSAGDLFVIISMASAVDRKTQKPYEGKAVIREALKGNENALGQLRSRYNGLADASSGYISQAERETMKLVLNMYAFWHKGLDKALKDIPTKSSIKAAANSTKHYRILSAALRDRWEMVHNPTPMQLNVSLMPEVSIHFTERFAKKAEQKVNDILRKAGKDPVDAVQTIVDMAKSRFKDSTNSVGLVEFAVAVYEDVIAKESYMDKGKDIPDEAIPFVSELAEWLFEETNVSQSLKYMDVRDELVDSGDRELEIREQDLPQFKNVKQVYLNTMRMMRSRFAAEHINFNTEALISQSTSDSIKISDEAEYYRKLANKECELVFSSSELKKRATDCAHAMINCAENYRWQIFEELKRRCGNPKVPEERKKKYRLIMQDLCDDTTWLKPALKFLLRSPRINGERIENIFEWAHDQVIGDAEGTDYGNKLHDHWSSLELRGLAELEAITGQRIILNSENIYEIKDNGPEENDENLDDTGMSDEEKRQNSDLESNHDKTATDFRDDIDPFSSLTLNTRLRLSRIPKIGRDGFPVVDQKTGMEQYYDPKFVYNSLLALVASRVITSKDFYRLVQPTDDSTKWPQYYPGVGVVDDMIDKTEAFPRGFPKFDMLEKVAAGQPWARGLILALTKSYADPGIDKAGIGASYANTNLGSFVTDLCNNLNFVFAERVRFRSKADKVDGSTRSSNMLTINRRGAVDSVRAVQRLNYMNNGIAYADNGLITKEQGTAIKNDATALEERSAIDVYMTHDPDTIMAYCDDVVEVLNRLGYAIPKGEDNPFFMELVIDGNLDAAAQLEYLVAQIKNLGEVYEVSPNTEADDDMYDNHGGVWDHLHQAVGKFVNPEYFQLTTTENGVTRQNMIAGSTFTKRMDELSYGYEAMGTMSKDNREELLKERQRRIDARWGHLKGSDGKYQNEFLQSMYEGKDLPDNPQKARAGARFWGGFVLMNNYDDIEFTALNEAQRLEVMLSGYLEQDGYTAEGDEGRGGALYLTPTLGDTKAAVFTRGRHRTRVECIKGMARFIRQELDSIAHNKKVANRWLAVQATEKGAFNGHAFLHPKTGKWVRYNPSDPDWEAAKILKKYRDAVAANNSALITEASKEWDELRKTEDLLPIDEASNKYQEYLEWQPTGTFFKQEQRICRLPRLNNMKLTVQELVDRQVKESVRKGLNTEEGATAYYTEQATFRFGDDMQRQVTVTDVHNAYADDLNSDMPIDEFIEDYEGLVEHFTEEALERQYAKQVKKVLQDDWAYKEKANLHRIECAITGVADFQGVVWEPELVDGISDMRGENGEPVQKKFLRDRNNPRRRRELSDKEYEYYQARKRGEYASPESEFKGDEGVHKIKTLREFRPQFINHGRLLQMIRNMKGKPSMDFNQVHEVVKDMFYNDIIHNEELLEILQIDHKFFKGSRDITKRLRGVMANGSGLDSQAPGGREVENILVYKDDVTAILPDYPNVVAAYINDVRKRLDKINSLKVSDEVKEQEHKKVIALFMDKISGHAKNNATNAQGFVLPNAYVVKGRMGGTQHMNSRIQKTITDAIEGKQTIDPNEFRPDSAAEPYKSMVMTAQKRTDPEGGVHWVPVYTKDTEVIVIPQSDELGSPKSARLEAMYRTFEGVEFTDSEGNPMYIHSMLSEEAMKSTRSGVIDWRYLQSRVDAAIALINGKTEQQFNGSTVTLQYRPEVVADTLFKEMDNVMKSIDFEEQSDGKKLYRGERSMTRDEFVQFLEDMSNFIKDCASEVNKDVQYLTFDDIDGFIHNGVGRIKGLQQRTEDWLTGKAKEEKSRKEIQKLMNMRNFFLPVKSTEATIEELSSRNLRGAILKADGRVNDGFIYKAPTADQKFQLRFSNHSVNGKSNLGSQESYIIPTAISFSDNITYSVAGHDVGGRDLLDLFNKCLAVRLFKGVAEIKELFGNTPEAMKKLQKRIAAIAQNNPKLKSDVINAIQIVQEATRDGKPTGKVRFNTPLSSVGVIYKLSDLLTSFVRSATHKRKINGSKVIIEGDIGYDDKLRLVRDPKTNRIIGIECYLPATSEDIMRLCMVTKNINGKDVQVLDHEKLKEHGLSEAIAYRIPTEDLHSIIPLIVKGFREQVHSGSIVVAGEVTTFTGGDNDGDGLFLMLKNVDPETGKAFEYDWDKPLREQDERAIENLLIDIIRAVVTHPSNEARFFSPQNPDTLKTISRRIAYAKLPNDEKLRKRVKQRKVDETTGEVTYVNVAPTFEYSPEDPDWENKDVFKRVESYTAIEQIPYDVVADHIDFMNEESITSPFSIIETGLQQALAKSGVAIASDGMAIYEKMLVALRIIGGYENGVSFVGDDNLPLGMRWENGKAVGYCAETDVDGTSIYENVNNYLAALVDSAKDLFTILIGLNEHNAAFAGFLLRCGFSPDMMCYAVALLEKHEGLTSKYLYGIHGALLESDETFEGRDLGRLKQSAFKKALSYDVITAKTLSHDPDVLNVVHCLSYLYRSFNDMHTFEATTKFNSAKNGLTNEAASAMYKILLVRHVLARVKATENDERGGYPVNLTEQMAIHPDLDEDAVYDGTFEDADGTVQRTSMNLSQMYYTTGIESFMKAAKGHLFYANEAYAKICIALSDIIMSMPQEEALKFMKRVHDEWVVFSLSDMNMFTHLSTAEGEEVGADFVKMRNFYKVQFPKNWVNDSLYPKDKLQQYEICKRLTYDPKSGKLTINGDLRNEAFRDEVQQSLVEMANSPDAQVRKLAVDLFIYSYFADGLRFGANSISNEFTSKFLSSKAFTEYNERIADMCTAKIPGNDIKRFLEQLVVNHAVDYQLGKLFRLGVSEVDKEGKPVKSEPVEDEISQQEVRRLEEWLAHEDSDGRIYTKPSQNMNPAPEVTDKYGKSGKKETRVLEFPSRLMSKVEKMEGGEVFRVQTTQNLYHQNVYMVVQEGTGKATRKYVIKLRDFQNGIVYNKAYSLETLAKMNTEGNPIKGTPGYFEAPGKGGKKEQRLRRDTLLGKNLKTKSADSEDNKPRTIEEQAQALLNGPSLPTGMDGMNMPAMPTMPNVTSPLFSAEPNMLAPHSDDIGLDEDEEVDKTPKEKVVRRPNDKTRRVNMRSFEYTANEDEDIMLHQSLGGQPAADNSPEAKAEALRAAGADGTFRSMAEAVIAAHRVQGFIPNIKTIRGSYKVELFAADDTDAAETWIEQYGKHIMETDDGLNDVMRGFGNDDVDFIDESLSYDEYSTIASNLIDMIDAALSGGVLPDISRQTAKGLINKLMDTSTQMIRLEGILEDISRNGLGSISNRDMIMLFSEGTDDERTAAADLMAQRIESGDVDESEDAVAEQVRSFLEVAIMNPRLLNERISDYIAANRGSLGRKTIDDLKWLSSQINNLLIERTLLPELNRVMDSRVGNLKNALSDLQNRSDVATSYTTPEEQRRNEEIDANARRTRNVAQQLKKIVEDALVMEERKRKMALEDKQKVTKIDQRIDRLKQVFTDSGNISIHGVLLYIESVAKEYDRWLLFFNSLTGEANSTSHQDRLRRMATLSKTLKSHEGILQELTELMDTDFPQKNNPYTMSDGSTITLAEIVKNLSDLHTDMRQRFAEYAPKEVIDFIKEFTGESYAMKNADGTHVTWEQLFYDKHGDISWTDQILRSMGNTRDPIGQVVDDIIKIQKDKVRKNTIKDQQTKIRDLYYFAESEHLTDFEFMFEHDENGHKTGYYVSETKNAEFYKELDERLKERDEVLEDRNATEAQREAAQDRYNAWVQENGHYDQSTGFVYPDPNKAGGRWKNPEYEEIMRDEKKRKFHEKFMAIKKEFDSRLGTRTAHTRAIQRRMTSEQRFRANFTMSPSDIWDNTKRKLADDFLVREDDYMEAGEYSTVLDYDGTPRMVTPAPYVRMLKNPDELSTDLIGCLMAYSYATNNYVAMREVTSPLEVMFEALVDNRITYEERNGVAVVEKFRHSEKQKAVVSANRFFKKLRSYMDTQLYMRYNQDEEDVFSLFGKKFRKSKVVAAFLHMSAIAQLGFNWLVDMASLANGLLQTNIEAASRRYFSGTALRKADAEYWKQMKEFIPDLARPFKQSKLSLVSQALDIQQNFDLKLYNNTRHQLLSRMFNTQIAFLGTTGGNHWLYHRVAIATMMETQITYTDEHGNKVTTNVWDAFRIKELEGGGKMAVLPDDAVDAEGTPVDSKWLYKLGEKIDGINHDLVGIYNRDDMVMAQKVWYGKLLMAFHKHIIPLFDRRWRKKHYDKNLERDVQGYMLTFGEFLKGIRNAQFNIPAAWSELDEYQKQDVRAAVTDIVQFLALLALSNLLLAGGDDDDDDEETRLKKWCKFLLARESHEMGSFINPLTAGKEAINILNNPVAGTAQLEDIYNFAHTVATPWTWDEKVKAGPFQGQSQLEMRTRKLPIPVLSYYRNMDKSMNGIDNSTWFYNRGYAGKV